MVKRIMRAFKMSEISAVTRPAQEGALKAIIKSRSDDIESSTDHGDVGKALNHDDADGEVVEAVRCSGGDQVGTKESPMTDNAKTADLEKQIGELKEELAKSVATIEAMNAAEIAKNDATIEVGGEVVRKSVVGDGVFKLLQAQAEAIAKANEATELAAFEKAAKEDFGNLPGEDVAKAKVLRSVEKMDEEVKADLEKMLKAANAAMGKAFVPVGADGGGEFAKAEDELDALAKAYATEHSVSFSKAYSQVMTTERGRELYARTFVPVSAHAAA